MKNLIHRIYSKRYTICVFGLTETISDEKSDTSDLFELIYSPCFSPTETVTGEKSDTSDLFEIRSYLKINT